MRGAEAWWENALACLCRRCEFYDVGTGNPTEVLRWRKSPGFCRKVTCLLGGIVRENPGGSRGAPRTRALGAHLSRAPLFLPCLPLSARPGLEPWATAHTGQTSPLEGRREGRGVTHSSASVCHLYLGGNGAFGMVVITSPLCSLLGISFPLRLLIS